MGLVLYLIPVALYLLYKWTTKNFDFFKKQGILYSHPLPSIIETFKIIFKKQPLTKPLMESYFKFKDEKVYGSFAFRLPIVFVRDPKIVKQLAVKDFDSFADHRVIIDESISPIMGKMLTALTGQKWKDMRSTLSPAFTGSKMRQMFDFVSDVGQQTAKTMSDEIRKGGESSVEFKALAMKFTVDVIASCAFGIEANSFKNPDNEFYRIATKTTSMNTGKQIFKFLGFAIAPKLMKFFGIEMFDKDIIKFFQQATHETMKAREEEGIIRPDMINLLMQARKGQLAHSGKEEKIADGFATVEESQLGKSDVKRVWDDDDLAAQCFLFFFAGFDTVATTMSYMAYELVCNPDIQSRLYEELLQMHNQLDGRKITYEQIHELKYLDQVICETLRKWPVAFLTDRMCVKEYDLKLDDGRTLHFNTDMNVYIPIHCFHHDPQYFPEPEKFDPERFSEENRGNIDPDTYMPFGVGPRNCIGSRFALMELKTIFYCLMLNFSFEANDKTVIPFEYENVPFAIKPINGFWMTLKPHEQLSSSSK